MEKKKIYSVYWSGEDQENYLALTDTEYENIIKVLEITNADSIVELVEIKIREF